MGIMGGGKIISEKGALSWWNKREKKNWCTRTETILGVAHFLDPFPVPVPAVDPGNIRGGLGTAFGIVFIRRIGCGPEGNKY